MRMEESITRRDFFKRTAAVSLGLVALTGDVAASKEIQEKLRAEMGKGTLYRDNSSQWKVAPKPKLGKLRRLY